MKLPGSIEERLDVFRPERRRLLRETDVADLEDAGLRVECALAGATWGIELRMRPQDIQLLRKDVCADFALLLARGDDAFEAHVIELKKSVGEREWIHIREQLQWAVVRLLAVAGILGARIEGVTVYTAFSNDKLARETSPNLVGMKIPVGPPPTTEDDATVRRFAEARRSWESGRFRMEVLGSDVEHRRIQTNEAGRAAVACRARPGAREAEARWVFEPVPSHDRGP